MNRKKSSTKSDSKNSKQLNSNRKNSRPSSKRTSLNRLRDELDYWFSKYIRAKASDRNGRVRCFTCKRYFHIGDIQAGHFVSRKHMSLRWSEVNTRCQCHICNNVNEGMQWQFGKNLDEEVPGTAEALMREKNKPYKLEKPFLIRAIEHYREQVENISIEKKIDWRKSSVIKKQRKQNQEKLNDNANNFI